MLYPVSYVYKPPLPVCINWEHPLARGLVGCWLFNEGGGNTVFDLSGYGNHGSFIDAPAWIIGKFGSALSFDGSNDRVSISSLNLGTRNTLALWVKYSTSDTYHTAPLGSGENSRYFFNRFPSNFYFKLNNSYTSHSYSAPLDEWLFLAWVRDNTDGDLYVNGEYHSTISNSNWDGIDTIIAEFGRIYDSNDYCFQGSLDCIMFFDHLLSPEEIWQLYTDPFCMFYHPLEAELLYAAPPVAALWRKIAYETEPPVAGWNKIKREAGTGWRKILYDGE